MAIHCVGVCLQCAVNGHAFEGEVLLGEDGACEEEAGEEEGEVFLHSAIGFMIQ